MSSSSALSLQILFLFAAGILILVNNNILLSVVPECSINSGETGLAETPSYTDLTQQNKEELDSLKHRQLSLELNLHGLKEDYRQAQARVNKLQMKFHESDKRLRLLELSEKMKKNEQTDDSLLPDFVIMGTWKGGTTSLYNIFQQHPSICMAIGEVNYFTNPSIKHLGLGLYQRFFQRCSQDRVLKHKNPTQLKIGEKSPTYLWNCAKICPLMKSVNPTVKLIVSLRDPIDRAYSQWSMDACKGIFNGTFEEFIEKNPKALNAGIYLDQVQALVKSFPKKQLFILKTEDFFNDTSTQLKKLEKFLGVDNADFTREQLRAYGSSPKCKKSAQNIHTINEKTLVRLKDFYKAPNQKLETFMAKQFGWGPLLWK